MSLSRLKIALTNRCNLDCSHCYLGKKGEIDLPSSMARKRMEEARSLGAHTVDLTGGEPTLHPEFTNLVDFASLLSFGTINVSTNGVLLKKDLLGCLRHHKAHCHVSLDGASADTVDAIRGVGVFSTVIAGLDKLATWGIRFSLRFCINRLNYLEVEQMLALAQAYKAKASLEPTQLCGNAQTHLLLDAPACEEVRKQLRRCLPIAGVDAEESFSAPLPCDGGQPDLISVAVNGEAVPCLMMFQTRESPCERTLVSMIADIRGAKTALRTFRPAGQRCSVCAHRGLCFSGCAVTAHSVGCLQMYCDSNGGSQ